MRSNLRKWLILFRDRLFNTDGVQDPIRVILAGSWAPPSWCASLGASRHSMQFLAENLLVIKFHPRQFPRLILFVIFKFEIIGKIFAIIERARPSEFLRTFLELPLWQRKNVKTRFAWDSYLVKWDGYDCENGARIESFDECVLASLRMGITTGRNPREPLEGNWDHAPTGCIIENMYDWRINYNKNFKPAYPDKHGLEDQYLRVCRAKYPTTSSPTTVSTSAACNSWKANIVWKFYHKTIFPL